MFFFAGLLNLPQCPRNRCLANLLFPKFCHFTLGFIPMRCDKISKLPPILDFEGLLAGFSGLRFDISRLSFALAPQVDRIATDIEQLARLTFVETIQLDRLHHFLSEVVAIGFSHQKRVDASGTSLVYVLTTMNTAIYSY